MCARVRAYVCVTPCHPPPRWEPAGGSGVPTLKELSRRWYPSQLAAAPAKKGAHRAVDDIHNQPGAGGPGPCMVVRHLPHPVQSFPCFPRCCRSGFHAILVCISAPFSWGTARFFLFSIFAHLRFNPHFLLLSFFFFCFPLGDLQRVLEGRYYVSPGDAGARCAAHREHRLSSVPFFLNRNAFF